MSVKAAYEAIIDYMYVEIEGESCGKCVLYLACDDYGGLLTVEVPIAGMKLIEPMYGNARARVAVEVIEL